MKNHRFLVFLVVILIALTLAACQRSASTPPPTDGELFPTVEGTQNPMDELGAFATQTAIAQQPEGETGTDGETAPEVEEPTEPQPPEEGETEEQPEATPVRPIIDLLLLSPILAPTVAGFHLRADSTIWR